MAVTGKSSLDCPVILFFAFLLLSPTTVFSEGNTESPAGSAPTAFQCRGHIEAAIKDFVTRQQYPQSSVPEKVVARSVDSGPPPVESEEDDEVTEIPETPTKDSEEEDVTEGGEEDERSDEEEAAPEDTEGVEDDDDDDDDDDQEKTDAAEGTEEEDDDDEDTEGGEGETEPEVAEAESAEDEEGEASKAEDDDDDDDEDEATKDDDEETEASKVEDKDDDDDEEATKADDDDDDDDGEASKVEDDDDDDDDDDGEATKAEDEDDDDGEATKADDDDDDDGEATKADDEDDDDDDGEATKADDDDDDDGEATKADDDDDDDGEATKAEDDDDDDDDDDEEATKADDDDDDDEEETKKVSEEDDEESAEAAKDDDDDEDDDEQTEKPEGSVEDDDDEESEEAKQADDDDDDDEEGTEEQKSAEAAASEEDDKDGDEATGEDEESGEASQEEAVGSSEQPQSVGEGDGDASEEETEQAGEHDSGEGDADGADERESLVDESQAEEPEEGSEETSVAARPEDSRSHEMIEKILGLDEVSMAATIATEKYVLTTLKELKHMYESSIKPMEVLYKFNEISNRFVGDAELFSKPMILFIGPWSSGKSTMINYLLDIEDVRAALTTGAEPQSNGFTVLTYGDQEQTLDGIEVAADWTFSSLQKFGESFLGRLQGKKLPSHLLRKVTIIDTPGILENRKQQERSYPFNDACQWFIDRADIIYVVFDPTKLDMGLEIEALFDQLKGRETQVRIILNKADSVKPQELMRVQSTLLWNLSPLLGCSEPPTIFVGTFWSKLYLAGSPETLFEAQEAALLNDLRLVIDGRVENRISFMRRHAVRVRNHAKMVDCYLNTYYNHKSFFANKKKVADEIIDNPQNYHIYEGLSTLTNVSRYDLPDPDIYRDFFRLNPLYDFKLLASTCSFFKGCPLDRLDLVIAYDLPELMGKYRKQILIAQDGTGEKR